LLGGLRVALLDRREDARHVVHRGVSAHERATQHGATGHAGNRTRSEEQKKPRRTTRAQRGHLDRLSQPCHKAGRSTPPLDIRPLGISMILWKSSGSGVRRRAGRYLAHEAVPGGRGRTGHLITCYLVCL
jgi:hypothetical protein